MARILLINGPNLNLLGQREPAHYGSMTLQEIVAGLETEAQRLGHELVHFQSNAEHELIERVHAAAGEDIAMIIANPAAFTHTSIALRDAFAAVGIPFVEVHLSDLSRREAFRQHSYFSDLALEVISGEGPAGYTRALQTAHRFINERA